MSKNSIQSASCQNDVIRRWKFFYEYEENGWHFFVDAKDHEEACDKAFELYGPEVEQMLYMEIKSNVV